jgi:hypothetical protein
MEQMRNDFNQMNISRGNFAPAVLFESGFVRIGISAMVLVRKLRDSSYRKRVGAVWGGEVR